VLEVRIDGRKPSEWLDLYTHPRIGHGWFGGGILRGLEIKAPHTPQTWVIEFTQWDLCENAEEGQQTVAFAYTVAGEKDGLLGSSSQGVYLQKGKWSWENTVKDGDFDSPVLKITGGDFYFGFKKPSLGTKYVFETRLNGTDVYNGSNPIVCSGLPVENHVLTLSAVDANNVPAITRIRIFNPLSTPLQTGEPMT
jgi:hypothetical protein